MHYDRIYLCNSYLMLLLIFNTLVFYLTSVNHKIRIRESGEHSGGPIFPQPLAREALPLEGRVILVNLPSAAIGCQG